MTTKTTRFPWLSFILKADPDHYRNTRIVPEYEFTAYGGGDPMDHEDGKRVFKGDYQTRGPYAPQEDE